MASGFTDYYDRKTLDGWFGNTALPSNATLYIGLITDANTLTQRKAGTVTEVSGNSYARVSVTQNTTNWPNAAGSNPASKTLVGTWTFPTPSGSWGTVTGYIIADAATNGNILAFADITPSQAVTTGNVVQFSTGNEIIVTQN